MLEKTFIERRVYGGAAVKRGYRVTGIECSRDGEDSRPVEIAQVKNMEEYSSGCKPHRGCFGHMCETPTGNLLPPQSLSFRAGDIRTQYYIACVSAFEGDPHRYLEELKKTNYKKEGGLRSVMATPVSGSGRLVAIPHNGPNPRVVYLSKNLASKTLFCLPERDSEGNEGARFEERCLRAGDWVMIERAPSLTKLNNQPFLLQYWDNECFGIHPTVFGYFHGDYDGDETHIYVLGTEGAREEARNWVVPVNGSFTRASRFMRDNFPSEYTGNDGDGDLEFLCYTTLSFSQIEKGDTAMPLGDLTRNKEAHLKMFSDRLRSRSGTKTFLEDAIKGVNDIMRQQLSQGRIGDMSRVARIAASCFHRGPGGSTYATTRRGRVLVDRGTEPSTGSPAVRCMMLLCSKAQQAALDAHRVGSVVSSTIDMVSDLLMGRKESKKSCKTLCVVSGCSQEYCRTVLGAEWTYPTGGDIVCVVRDDAVTRDLSAHVVGAYSPVVLATLPSVRRRAVCSKAVNLVFNYYDLSPEGDDLCDVVSMYCHRVEASDLPVTTREGLFARGLGWMETLMACDYTKLPQLKGSFSRINSATSATMCANFSLLP